MTHDAHTQRRIEALKEGRIQWGHDGTHHGTGTTECPTERHHHHDVYCAMPTAYEMAMAGVQMPDGGWHTRR